MSSTEHKISDKVAIFGNLIMKLIDKKKFTEIKQKKVPTEVSYMFMFYFMYKDVDIVILQDVFEDILIDDLYSIIRDTTELFKTSKETSNMTKEQLQKIVVDYVIKHKPDDYLDTLIRWYVETDDRYIRQVIKSSNIEEDELVKTLYTESIYIIEQHNY